MDISSINDLMVLKAIAYDEIAKKEQAINNLVIINQRITQITQPALPNDTEDEAAPADGQIALDVNGNAPTDASADGESTTTTTTVEQ